MTNRMHESHDLDLVAALAEGRLADPRSAEELVAACPECADLYHAHRTVLEAVEREPKTELTEMESHRIRAQVWNAVGAASDSPPASTTPRTTPAWYRILGAAAALAVVVGVAGVLVTGQGGDDSATDTIAAEHSDTGSDTTDEDLRALAGAAESADTTSAAADTMITDDTVAADGTEADDETAGDSGAAPPSYTLAGLEPALESFLERFREEATDRDAAFVCPDVTSAGETVEAAEPALVDGEPVWFVVVRDGAGADEARAYRQDDCQPVLPSE